MADNINVNPTGTTQVATDEIAGVHYQKVMPVNSNGDVGAEVELSWITRMMAKVLGRFSFAADGTLRMSGPVTVSSGTVTTVTTCATVTTANVGIGDSGKPSAIMQNSAIMYYGSVRRNFV